MLTDITWLVSRKNHNIFEIQTTGQLTADDFKVQTILGKPKRLLFAFSKSRNKKKLANVW